VLTYADKLPHEGDWADTNIKLAQAIVRAIHQCIPPMPTDGNTLFDARVFIPDEDPEAAQARHAFDTTVSEDPTLRRYVPRITSHVKRDVLLRAVFSKERRITKEHMERAIKWGWHQIELRRLLWPEEGGSLVERMEQKITAALQKYGHLSDRELVSACNVNRPRSGGSEVYNRAKTALLYSKQIEIVGETRKKRPIYGQTNESES
jgi:hypothetical protein